MPYSDPKKQREASLRHYYKNKEAILKKADTRRADRRAHVQQLKESSPCVDCGQFYRYFVMQFDHIGADKVADISSMISRRAPWKRVLEEIAKCELVCANCHATRTWARAK